jgi:hypothetical protein
VPTIVLAQAASSPALRGGNAKAAALLGLGWTEFKMSSLNRFNRTGTTKPVKPMGAEREKPLVLAVGQAQKNSNRKSDTSTNGRTGPSSSLKILATE